MRIAYFTESLPPQTDGVANTMSRLAESLTASDINFRFFSPFVPTDKPWRDRVYKIASVPLPLYPEYKIGMPVLHNLKKELDGFSPDLVHVASPTWLGIAGQNYAAGAGKPVVASYHTQFASYLPYYGLSIWKKAVWNYLRWFYNRCQLTLAPSPSVAAELNQNGFSNIGLWQRGIDIGRFSPRHRDHRLRHQLGLDGALTLLFVGRLVKEKNLEILLAAVRLLRAAGYRFNLVLVGDGPMRNEIRHQAPEAHLTGYLHDDMLSRMYASADIFVFPSTTETFGNVIAEAAASGLPCVGARAGGVQDNVKDEFTGLLAEPDSPTDFAAKIARLLEDEQTPNGAQCRSTGTKSNLGKQQSTIDGKVRKLAEHLAFQATSGFGAGQATFPRTRAA
jgi:glycosyltransferase involved in cell wall biosynthesis